jgi:Mg/Co/Ni transporter MgtE
MLVKILGILDITAAATLLLLRWDIGAVLGIVLGIYILAKSFYFMTDVASIVDIGAGLFLILAAIGFYHPITYIFVLWLLQKGVSSLFA